MANRARIAAWTAMAAMVLAGSPASAEPVRKIAIRVCFDSPSSDHLAMFEQAKQEATAIYEAVGISLEWSAGASTDAAAMHLMVVVLSDTQSDRVMKNSPQLAKSVLGVAPVNSGRVYVFVDRIIRHAMARQVLSHRVLGRVLAHEIGHHLLPARGHSDTGLMRRSLNYEMPQSPTFTAAQVDQIRTLLVAAN
jgi:hypothetical protein